MSVVEHTSHDTGHGSGAPRRRGLLMRPGFIRGAWCFALFFLVGLYLVAGIRWLAGWDPVYDWNIIVVVGALTMGPIGFLLGIGAFDYWLYWISGRPTLPEDHSNHGAKTWQDYFKVNTDHKVIGVQYLATTFFFFVIGGLMAMLFRAELAQPGMQFVDTQTFNGLVSVHAALMIFVFIIPAFAGLANFAVPLMLGAPDMAFPRLNALSYWLLPIAGTMFLGSFLAPGGAFATGWTSYAPLASDQPIGQVFFNMGVQWAGASSILTALNFLVTIITMRAPGMTFWRMPLLVWANFTTSLLVVIATPFIAGSQFFVMFDRVMHTSFFVPAGRRLRARLPAHLLVLQPPGRLHHDPARLRDHLRDHLGDEPQADLRLPADGALAARDPRARLLGLGPPHVRRRHGRLAARPDDDHDAADRGADRDQGVQLAGDPLGGADPPQHADAVRPRLHLDVRDRRPLGHLPRRRCRSTSTPPTPTSSSRTSTTCSSAAPCSRSSPASTTGSRR